MARRRRYYDPGANPYPANYLNRRRDMPLMKRAAATPRDVDALKAAADKRARKAAKRRPNARGNS